ncbi:hypothetical protein K1719_016077 [Acacia pycnantha]|nr:hypothetical protein K1719_016077 [Acacia pycnantha]
MNAQKSAVERFSNLLHSYKSMKIVMASFVPFEFLDQFALFSQMSVNWSFLESFLISRKVDRTSKVYLYSAVKLDSVEELKKNIKRHLRSHETSSSTEAFDCEHKDCSSTFTTKSNLEKHEKAVHFKEKPFVCRFPDCGMRFSYKHVREIMKKLGYMFIHMGILKNLMNNSE